MPGIVGLIALIIAAILAFAIAAILIPLLKYFLSKSWGWSVGVGLLVGFAVSGILLYVSFRPASENVTRSEAERRFPELKNHGANFQYGLSFQDGLSDGHYIVFNLDKKGMSSLHQELAKTRSTFKFLAPDNMQHSHFSNLEPVWFSGSECLDGKHYEAFYGRERGETPAPELDRFTVHFCPELGKIFIDDVRI